MQSVEKKREQGKKLVSLIITLYCHKHHRTTQPLCTDCEKLKDYAQQRSNQCPFMAVKAFCSNCKVPCYNTHMRERIQAVMQYSDPRMIFYHPIVAVKHIIETVKEKKSLEEQNEN